jgi:hypothetical protein
MKFFSVGMIVVIVGSLLAKNGIAQFDSNLVQIDTDDI